MCTGANAQESLALFYWKRVKTHAKLYRQPKPGDWPEILIVWLTSELTKEKPCKVSMYEELAPL